MRQPANTPFLLVWPKRKAVPKEKARQYELLFLFGLDGS